MIAKACSMNGWLLLCCFPFGGNSMVKSRDLSFDAFRGLAIIAVVAIHAMSVFEWGPSKTGVWDPFSVITYYRQSLSLAVPVFIFISGYWASIKPIESLSDYRIFLIKKLSRTYSGNKRCYVGASPN